MHKLFEFTNKILGNLIFCLKWTRGDTCYWHILQTLESVLCISHVQFYAFSVTDRQCLYIQMHGPSNMILWSVYIMFINTGKKFNRNIHIHVLQNMSIWSTIFCILWFGVLLICFCVTLYFALLFKQSNSVDYCTDSIYESETHSSLQH